MLNYQKLNQLLKIYKISVKKDEALVTLENEFGYKNYIWKPEMSCKEFERWWKRQHHIDVLDTTLPGKLIDVDKIIKRHAFKPYSNIEEMFEHMEQYYLHIYFERWVLLDKSGLCYHAHFFDDVNSYLILYEFIGYMNSYTYEFIYDNMNS
jgi:hypothetical protein